MIRSLYVLQKRCKKNNFGYEYYEYRFNPYNPLTYILLAVTLPYHLIKLPFSNNTFKNLFNQYKNSFKYE